MTSVCCMHTKWLIKWCQTLFSQKKSVQQNLWTFTVAVVAIPVIFSIRFFRKTYSQHTMFFVHVSHRFKFYSDHILLNMFEILLKIFRFSISVSLWINCSLLHIQVAFSEFLHFKIDFRRKFRDFFFCVNHNIELYYVWKHYRKLFEFHKSLPVLMNSPNRIASNQVVQPVPVVAEIV